MCRLPCPCAPPRTQPSPVACCARGCCSQILSFTTQIYNFAWEPVGTRFGIIHQGEGPGRFQTVFYDMGAPGSQHQLLCTSLVALRLCVLRVCVPNRKLCGDVAAQSSSRTVP